MASFHYDWPEYYDIVSSGLDHDVEFYTELIRETKGPVLELGCGTGRVTLPAARTGKKIIGLDSSSAMLDKAVWKAKMARAEENLLFIEGDMRCFQLEERFSLVIIPYRSFQHLLSIKDQIAALKHIYQHLIPKGILAFNIFVPNVKQFQEEDEKSTARGIYEIPGSEDRLIVWDYTRFDHFQQIGEIIRQYDRVDVKGEVVQKIVAPIHLRYTYPVELHHLLKLAGFTILHQYGDFSGTAFGPESKELVIVARKE